MKCTSPQHEHGDINYVDHNHSITYAGPRPNIETISYHVHVHPL
jgi:hypothetical protein